MSENLFGNQKLDNFDMKVRVIALGGAGCKYSRESIAGSQKTCLKMQ